MRTQRLLVGDVATRAGVSRKALRLYESLGILVPPGRTPSGYRTFGEDVVPLLGFVGRARRMGFTLREIRDIIALRRTGQRPCGHVEQLARAKLRELDQRLSDLTTLRRSLAAMLVEWEHVRKTAAAVCPCIESGEPVTPAARPTRRKA